jgi:hypothetical protein
MCARPDLPVPGVLFVLLATVRASGHMLPSLSFRGPSVLQPAVRHDMGSHTIAWVLQANRPFVLLSTRMRFNLCHRWTKGPRTASVTSTACINGGGEQGPPPGEALLERGGGGFPRTPSGKWQDVLTLSGAGPDVEKHQLGGDTLLLTDKRSRMRGIFDLELTRVARATVPPCHPRAAQRAPPTGAPHRLNAASGR